MILTSCFLLIVRYRICYGWVKVPNYEVFYLFDGYCDTYLCYASLVIIGYRDVRKPLPLLVVNTKRA
jgi:hypothetical protein